MSDIFGHYFIQDEEENYKLGANFDIEKKVYYMPMLEFLRLYDKDYPNQTLMWDNSAFIFNQLKEFLERYLNRKLLESDKMEFSDIWDILDEKEAKVILKLLEQGFILGWDKL